MEHLIQKIKEYSAYPFVIAGHVNPDFDCVGSALALALGLNAMGINAKVLMNDKYLPMLDQIGKSHLRDCIIGHDDVPSEYVFFGVDCSSLDRYGEYEPHWHGASHTLVLDHHHYNIINADAKYVDEDAGSTTEILLDVLEQAGVDISQDMADLMYVGLATDTLCFSVSLRPNTMLVASRLLAMGVDYEYLVRMAMNNNTIHDMKILDNMIGLLEYDTIHFLPLDTRPANAPDYEKYMRVFSGTLLNLAEVERMAVLVIHDDKIKVTFRGKKAFNVLKLQEIFGGGGHMKACGFTYPNTDVEQCKRDIVDYINKYCE